MALEIKSRLFKNIEDTRVWMSSARLSPNSSRLPFLVKMDFVDSMYRVIYAEESALAGDQHAFTRRGLVGVQVAAGLVPDGNPVLSSATNWYPIGESEGAGSAVDEVIGTGDTVETDFSGDLAKGMVVPGTLVVSGTGVADLVEPVAPLASTGALAGDDGSGTIDHLSRAFVLAYTSAPDAADITASYDYDPFPGSVAIPSSAHLVRLEIERLAGTGANVDFTWTLAEDDEGHSQIQTGTTGAMALGARVQVDLDRDTIIQDPLLAEQGRRWIGLQSDAADDHIVLVKALFRVET